MKDSPYKFLDFYDLKDREIFFGRESEINILVADILVSRLVVLFARTGTGKTSLINAGVRPLLESKKIKTFYMRVEQEPTEAAKSVLSKTDRAASLTTQLISAVDSSIDPAVGKSERPVVLFFDQFEEFFLQIKSPETRQKFISYVAQIYKNPESGVHLVFSMREEYFYMMDEFRSEIPSIFHKNSNLRLMPLDEDQARDAIIKPAAARNVKWELDLANKIIEDLRKQNDKDGIRAPSLQIICDTLWSREDPNDRHITMQDYDELGGAQNILDRRLAEDLELALAGTGLIPLAQNLIDKLRTDENTKYPRLFSDLVETLGTDDVTLHTLVDQLKGVRLIKDTTISNAPAIEWASDYLAGQTPNLLRVVKKIEINRILESAVNKSRDTRLALEKAENESGINPVPFMAEEELNALYFPEGVFEQLSQNIEYLKNLNSKEILLFLFDAALFHQRYMQLWFKRISQSSAAPLEILREKIYDKKTHINLSVGAIHLLAELGSDQAYSVLEEALNEPDLALEVVDMLVETQGTLATQLLAKALERDDLWETAALGLARVTTGRAVTLLQPLAQQDNKSFQVINILERIMITKRGQTGAMAAKAILEAIPIFESRPGKDPLPDAILEHLSQSAETKIRDAAIQARRKRAMLNQVPGNRIDRDEHRLELLGPRPGLLENLISIRNIANIVPVISDAFRINQVFQNEQPADLIRFTPYEQLTKSWAQQMNYPMADDHILPRVAQYAQINRDSSDLAKEEYVDFLKKTLLEKTESQEGYEAAVYDLWNPRNDLSFSEIVQKLDYPRFPDGIEDPLRLLARLPLPIYITTSYYDFVEQQLLREGKNPRTQVIVREKDLYDVDERYLSDSNVQPTVKSPAVYHLYGVEDSPSTMVMSEDEYLRYLIHVAQDTDTLKPIVPLRLRRAFASSHLLLLGYRQQDWDFRTLFRLILENRMTESGKQGIFVQFASMEENSQSLEYVKRYFNLKRFEVQWSSPELFIQSLWDVWKDKMQ